MSAVIWVGGMVGFIISSYPAIKQIPNEKLMVRTSIRTLKKLLGLFLIVSISLLISGFIISIGASYNEKDPVLSTIIGTKEILWLFMFINITYAYFKTLQAKKRCLDSDSTGAGDNIRLISNYLLMINIFLGVIASYFGLMLRG